VHSWLRNQPGNIVAENEVAVWTLAYRAFVAAHGEAVTFCEFKALMIGAGLPAVRRVAHDKERTESFVIAAPQAVGGRAITRASFQDET
jgi:hypothetical protein